MALQSSVDFTIRANDLTSKPTRDIVSAFSDLDKAQTKVSDSASKVTSSTSQLKDQESALLSVITELEKRLGDVSKYEKNEQSIESLSKSLADAKTRYQDFTQTLFQAQESGNSTLVDTTRSNLKILSNDINTYQRQISTLSRQQDALRSKAGSTTGLDLSQGSVASSTTTDALAQARQLLDINRQNQVAVEREAAAEAGYQEYLREEAEAQARITAQLKEQANFQAKLEAAASQNSAQQYQLEYLRLLEEQDTALKSAAAEEQILSNLAAEKAANEQKAADALQRYQDIGKRANTALDVSQAARTSPTASAPSTSASAAVSSLLDPFQSQTSTLRGVESALSDIETAIDTVGKSSDSAAQKVKILKDAEDQLNTVTKSLGQQAGFIDKLNTQNAAVDAARQRLIAAEAEVRRYATEIQNAAQADDTLVVSLQQAQGRLQGAQTSFNSQAATLERLKAAASSAGVDVNNLAGQETRLVDAASRAAASQKTLGDALDSAGKSGNAFTQFLEAYETRGRTSLSFTQRLRGEVIGLAAGYIGLQGALAALGSTLDAVNTKQQVQAQISQLIPNDTAAQAKQYQFLIDQANRTSTSFESVAKGYTQLARQAREYGLEQNTINKLIADTLTVSRSNGQTNEQLEQTFVALGQIFDKGTIQAQELKTQLGNAGIAGITTILAKVVGGATGSVAALNKQMEAGNVAAANIVETFSRLADEGDIAFNKGMQSYSAQVARFRTQLFTLENQFAESGFLTAVSDGLDRVSNLLKDPAVQANLQKLGQSIGSLIELIATLATNTDVLSAAFTALEVLLAGKLIISLASTSLKLTALAADLEAAGGAAATFAAAIGFGAGAGAVGAAIALGTALGVLIDKIPGVTNELDRLANGNFWDTLERRSKQFGPGGALVTGLEKLVALPGEILGNAVGELVTGNELEKNNEKLQKNEEIQKNILALNKQRNDIIKEGTNASAVDLALLKIYTAQQAALEAQIGFKRSTPLGSAAPAKSSTSKVPGVDEAAAEADVARKTTLDGIEKTNAEAQKLQTAAQTKELKSRKDFLDLYTLQEKTSIDAANKNVQTLQDSYNKSKNQKDLDALTKAKSALNALNEGIQAKADADYAKARASSATKLQAQQESFEKKLQSLHQQTAELQLAQQKSIDALLQKEQDDSLKARLAAVDDGIKQVNQKYEEQIAKNNQGIAQGTKAKVDTSQLQADNALLEVLKARLPQEQAIAEQLATQKFNLDEANKAEADIQEKLKLRSALLSAIEAQQKARDITRQEAQVRTRQVNANTLGGSTGIDASITNLTGSLQKQIDQQTAAGNGATAYTQKLRTLQAEMIALKASTDASAASTDDFSKTMGQALGSAITSDISTFVTEIGKAGAGVESLGKAWTNVRDAALNSIADILEQLAIYLIKVQIAKALMSAANSVGGGWGSILSSAATVVGGKSHTGNVVGAGGSGGATPMLVNPTWFLGAPRYHTGGLPGLAPDEYPIIAQRGEEILSKNNPRNILNGGQSANTSEVGPPGGDVNVHLHADAESFFTAGLNSKGGSKNTFAFFEANKSKLSKILNSR